MHSTLCKKASNRLRRNHSTVLIEPQNVVTLEIPDVIGWKSNGSSTVIECKTNRADFFRDKKKLCRRSLSLGMGNYRIYFCPAGLIHLKEVPESWGLWWLYPSGRIVAKKKPERMESSKREELKLALWRLRTMEVEA